MTLSEFVDQLIEEGAESVWLYGSVAKGTATPGSDVDLFIAAPKPIRTAMDERYWMDRPRVLVDGVYREAHLVFEPTTHTNDAAFFVWMQPEARRIDRKGETE